MRSHDQYNTTIYGLDDRYRGISGRRDIVFMNAADLAARGLSTATWSMWRRSQRSDDAQARVSGRLTAVAFDIASSSAAAYYPEANPLVALDTTTRAAARRPTSRSPCGWRGRQKVETPVELADTVAA